MAEPQGPAADEFETDEFGSQAEQSTVETLTKERDENFQKFLRAQAEMETARRRWRQELEELRKYQSLPVIKDLLPSLDNLRRAVDAAKSGTPVEALRSGVEMVLKQIDEAFAKHGAQPIPAIGKPFDPHLHEAITQIPTTEQPAGNVVLEAERGYQMHDRVVRPSKVGVAIAPQK
jgi:molecular chaperone GrpE